MINGLVRFGRVSHRLATMLPSMESLEGKYKLQVGLDIEILFPLPFCYCPALSLKLD